MIIHILYNWYVYFSEECDLKEHGYLISQELDFIYLSQNLKKNVQLWNYLSTIFTLIIQGTDLFIYSVSTTM